MISEQAACDQTTGEMFQIKLKDLFTRYLRRVEELRKPTYDNQDGDEGNFLTVLEYSIFH